MNRFNRLIQFYHRHGCDNSLFAKFLRLFLYRWIRWYYHCDIPYEAEISGVLFMHKGFGVVLNAKSIIGEGTVIQHSVTVGHIGDGVPTIGKNCFIGAGAIIIGGITVGNNVKIGAGAVVNKDIPDGCTAVGVPARVIQHND